MNFFFNFCKYLIEFGLDAAGFQSQLRKVALLHLFYDLYDLIVVLSTDLTRLSEVNVVGDQALVNAIPQQRHNLVSVPKKQAKVFTGQDVRFSIKL